MMELMSSPQAWFVAQCLLHFVWQGAIVGIAAAAVLAVLGKVDPRVRYGAACVFLLAAALCPLVTFVYLSRPGAATPPLPFTAGVELQSYAPVGAADAPWFVPVVALWSAGVMVFSLRALGGWALAAWRLSRRRRAADEAVREAVDRLSAQLGIRRVVRVYESATASVPSVFGAIRPVIVLPAAVVTGMPAAQIEAILAHELAHVARHDFLVNCLQTAAEVLLFYHPAVWWLSRVIRQERELCCDAIAAGVCGDRVTYSRALLALEESRQQFALAASGGDLKSRIAYLLHGAHPATPRFAAVAPVAVVAAMVVGAAVFALRAQAPGSPYERWLNEDVFHIITPEERTAYLALRDDAERARFIDQFWLRRDPTPGTQANEAKEEHYRRLAYTMQRFGSSARARIYIVFGPPDEIESHPREYREVWVYLTGMEFEFNGPAYDLTWQGPFASRPRPGRPPVMARIGLEHLPEPLRTTLHNKLIPFLGRPMSNDLMQQIRNTVQPIEPTAIIYRWSIDPATRNAALDLYWGRPDVNEPVPGTP